jgi:phosphoribosyl-dephospho-CoA transferase
MDSVPRVHDLLALRSGSMMTLDSEPPAESTIVLGQHPWVVVRRGATPEATIAVGLRGAERHERWGGFVDAADVLARKGPEQLRCRLTSGSRRLLPAFQALAFLEYRLDGLGLDWGPGGSVGFELASGEPVVKDLSDLDIMFFVADKFEPTEALRLWKLVSASPGRVDALVETPYCGFSLEEYATGHSGRLLLRTQYGRMLGYDPWTAPDMRHV